MHTLEKDLLPLLKATGFATYSWDMQTDSLSWQGDVTEMLQISDRSLLSTGRGYSSIFDETHENILQSTIRKNLAQIPSTAEEGIPYKVTYALCPKGQSSMERIWVEDTGHWFPGADGMPARAVGMIHCIDEQHKKEQYLQYLSKTDELTGQLNRWALTKNLEFITENSIKNTFKSAFLIVAMDNLNLINESYGFDIADELLKNMAFHLRTKIRGGDTIGRYSGNKFGIILQNCHDPNLEQIIERLMSAAREIPIGAQNNIINSTISIGCVRIPDDAQNAKEAMTNAQIALHEAKKAHRDTFVIYNASKKQESTRQRNFLILDMVTSALNQGRITYALQPVVSAETEEAAFHECLIRMRQPDHSILQATAFLREAESLGLIKLLDYRILELTLAHLVQKPDIHLAVNISVDTTLDPAWLDLLRMQALSNPDIPRRLIIEITETRMITEPEQVSRLIKNLREWGYKIAIDDFGAGYTSFRNLQILQVDLVKIDGSFIQQLSQKQENQHFVRILIDLAKTLKIKTVAEWVETPEDAQLLKEFGIDYMQGYLFGKARIHEEEIPSYHQILSGCSPDDSEFSSTATEEASLHTASSRKSM